jgi:KDO2-lipid IV(A) lauroyltransferase
MSPPAPRAPWHYRLLVLPLLALAYLPLGVLYGLARVLYWLLAYVVRYRQRVVLDNLRHAFPEKSEAEVRRIGRRFYWHFAQLLVEIIKLAAISPRELGRRVRFTNPELALRPLAEQRLVLVLGSHLCNWEWLLVRAGEVLPGEVAGVYKVLSNKFFEWFMRRLRTRLGARAVPMHHTLRYLVQHRGTGHTISLLLDQAAGPADRPYWTEFMHRDAGFYSSADRLAPQFEAVVLYVGIRRVQRGHYTVTFAELPGGPPAGLGPTAPESLRYPATEAFVRHLEADIRAAPEQYLWTHRRWKHVRNA